jgi:hypothetical protein
VNYQLTKQADSKGLIQNKHNGFVLISPQPSSPASRAVLIRSRAAAVRLARAAAVRLARAAAPLW